MGPRQKLDQLLGPDLDTLKVALDKDAPMTTRNSSMRTGAGRDAGQAVISGAALCGARSFH